MEASAFQMSAGTCASRNREIGLDRGRGANLNKQDKQIPDHLIAGARASRYGARLSRPGTPRGGCGR
jgi:hypothetical protein